VTGLFSAAASIDARTNHSLAVRNGGVFAWGGNADGQLGDGTTTSQLTPEQIVPADLRNVVADAAGPLSSYALSSDGSLWVWGHNFAGEQGSGTSHVRSLPLQHLLPPGGYTFTTSDADSEAEHAVATLAAVPELSKFVLAGIGFSAYSPAFGNGAGYRLQDAKRRRHRTC
jgi:alpha-tubulin suppressor-like RCC1 family protein